MLTGRSLNESACRSTGWTSPTDKVQVLPFDFVGLKARWQTDYSSRVRTGFIEELAGSKAGWKLTVSFGAVGQV
jgi:hypothetical protein